MTPVTRPMVVQAAQSWLDVPFHHQGRSRVLGVDCVGLVIAVALDLEIIDEELARQLPHTYQRLPDPSFMADMLHRHMDSVRKPRVGDWIWLGAPCTRPRHLALMSGEDRIIHAYEDVGRVTEQSLRRAMQRMIRGAWSYRGLVDV